MLPIARLCGVEYTPDASGQARGPIGERGPATKES